ncbi:hypothetical protein DID88_001295 [Monilinia fructigena]|uniref:Uncharacterized protein n=1 Tax=Monilinia fructigena TaxID=38457 RepID=A0A395J3F0_9HELO|nr:hypothetical protein DID88_001295 [Monilinia fructigena]
MINLANAPPEIPASVDLPLRPGSSFSRRPTRNSVGSYSSVSSRAGRSLVQPPSQDPPLKPSDVVPSATYIERGLRWMEKEEAASLREAMEDMDTKEHDEEVRIHSAAQERKHLIMRMRELRALDAMEAFFMATSFARDTAPRTGSIGSDEGQETSGNSNPSSPIKNGATSEPTLRGSLDSGRDAMAQQASTKTYGSVSRLQSGRRTSGGGKRNISGELKGSFTGEQIWEEPRQETTDNSDQGQPSDGRPASALQAKPEIL